MAKLTSFVFVFLLSAFVFLPSAGAQSTETTYQGQLQSSSTPANGSFDFEFSLFDALSGGSQIGATITQNGVAVANGVFSVNLDFGSSFPGAARFLEIHVRPTGGGAFTPLTPRQPFTSTPYSLRSLNAVAATTAASAATATSFTGNLAGDVTGTQSTTTVNRLRGRDVASTAPLNGQVLKFNSTTNQWEPDTDNTGAGGGGGTITGVTPGTGLSGGGATGNVTLNIANAGVGTTQLADASVTDAKITAVSGAKVTGAVATATNAQQLGGVAATQFVVTTDPRMTDARTPTAGSVNYIQNTASPQASSNFNISGNGTAGGMLTGAIVDATTQFNINGNRVLSVSGPDNVFAGVGAGTSTTGESNSFFGRNAGSANTTGISNSFFGRSAGLLNGGNNNSFFGRAAGLLNSNGNDNSFFGLNAGGANTTGSNNTALGSNSTFGAGNLTFATSIGAGAVGNTSNSVTLGRNLDTVQIPGNLNVVGALTANINGASITNLNASNIASGTLNNARLGIVPVTNGGTGSATQNFVDLTTGQTIGGDKSFNNTLSGNVVNAVTQYNIAGSRVFSVGGGNTSAGLNAGTTSGVNITNNAFFGLSSGAVNTGQNNTFVGSAAGDSNTSGSGNTFFGRNAGGSNTTGLLNTIIGQNAGIIAGNLVGNSNTLLGAAANVATGSLDHATAIGADAVVSNSNRIVLGRAAGTDIVQIPGDVIFQNLGAAGGTALCLNAGDFLAFCSSSLRYKTNISSFGLGLDLVKRLKPITFDWKDGGKHDLGLGAEDVAAIEPLLITYNKTGQIEGVKYDRIGVVLVNAVKEQQTQIEELQKRIEVLTKAICSINPKTDICRQK